MAERKHDCVLSINGHHITVALPPSAYKSPTINSSVTEKPEYRTFLIIHNYDLFDYDDWTNEFKDHMTVELVKASCPVSKCLFMGREVDVHPNSECMTARLKKDEKCVFLSADEQKKLTSHLGHQGLYVELADPKWIDFGIYVKMTSDCTGQFQGQTVKIPDFSHATSFICIECRGKGLVFMHEADTPSTETKNTVATPSVFHGSPSLFDVAKPSSTRRTAGGVVTYQSTSLHATPLFWVALAYTAKRGGRSSFGVSLFRDEKSVLIYGPVSLEESLAALYDGERYVYDFPAELFSWKEGLAPLEVVSCVELRPSKVHVVRDAVAAMREAGVSFGFECIPALCS